MKKILILIGALALILILVPFGLYLSRNSLVKSVMLSKIEEELPGSKAEIGDLEITLGNTLGLRLTNLKIEHEKQNVLSLKNLTVDLPEILSRQKEGSVSIRIDGVRGHLTRATKLAERRPQDLGKVDDKNSKPFSAKDLKDLAKFEVNLHVTDVELQSVNEAKITTINLPEFKLTGAKLSSRFPVTAKLAIKNENLSYHLTQDGTADFSRFIEEEKAQVNFNWKGIGEANKKAIPELKVSLDANLDLNGDSTASFIARATGIDVTTRLIADFRKQTFNTQELKADITPGLLIDFDQNLQIKLTGEAKGTFERAVGKIDFTTTGFSVPRPENKSLEINPSTHHASFDVGIKGKSLVATESRYAQSFLKSEVILMDADPKEVKVSSEALIKDLAPLLAQVSPDFTLKRNDSKLTLAADVDLTKSPVQAKITAKNHGDLLLTNKEGHTVALTRLELESTPQKAQQEFVASVHGNLTPSKLKSVPFRTELKGLINDAQSPQFKQEMLTSSFLFETGENTSKMRAQLSVGENRFALKNLDGMIQLSEFLPLLPPETRALFSPKMPKTTGLSLAGNVDYADGKLKDSKLAVNLTQALSIRKDENSVLVEKLSLESVPSKQQGVLALALSLEAKLSSTLTSATAPLTHVSDIQIDLEKTSKDKAPAVTSTHTTKLFKNSSVGLNLGLKQGVTSVTDLKGLIHLHELFPFVPATLKQQLAPLKTTKSQLKFAGTIRLKDQRFQKLDLQIGTTAPVPVMAMEGVPAEASLDVKLADSKISVRSTLALLQGEVLVSMHGPGPKSTEIKNPFALLPKVMKLKLDNLQVPRSLLQKILHPKDVTNPVVQTPRKDADFATLVEIKELDIEVEPSRITVEKKPFGLVGSFNLKKGQLKSRGLKLTQEQGTVAIDVSAKFQPKSMEARVNTDISRFELGSLSGFLPPIVEAVTGLTQGTLSADARLAGKDPVSYDARFALKVVDGELKKINLTEQIGSILQKLDFLGISKGKEFAYSDKFKEFSVRGTADEKVINLDDLKFTGLQNTLSVAGKGNIGQLGSKQKSLLMIDLTDPNGKIGAALKENTGLDVLPIRLTGIEIELSPDYQYTVGKVGKGATKKVIETQGKKILGDFLKKKGF